MSVIKDIIKLDSQGLSLQEIAKRVKSSKSAVKRYLDRAKTLGIDWSVVKPMSETEVKALFVKQREVNVNIHIPNWDQIYLRSKGKNGLTLKALWQEYVNETHKDKEPLTYSTFCRRFNAFTENLPPSLNELSMTMVWEIGDVAMIDYAGTKMFLIDPDS